MPALVPQQCEARKRRRSSAKHDVKGMQWDAVSGVWRVTSDSAAVEERWRMAVLAGLASRIRENMFDSGLQLESDEAPLSSSVARLCHHLQVRKLIPDTYMSTSIAYVFLDTYMTTSIAYAFLANFTKFALQSHPGPPAHACDSSRERCNARSFWG